jgi:hypothetical protein
MEAIISRAVASVKGRQASVAAASPQSTSTTLLRCDHTAAASSLIPARVWRAKAALAVPSLRGNYGPRRDPSLRSRAAASGRPEGGERRRETLRGSHARVTENGAIPAPRLCHISARRLYCHLILNGRRRAVQASPSVMSANILTEASVVIQSRRRRISRPPSLRPLWFFLARCRKSRGKECRARFYSSPVASQDRLFDTARVATRLRMTARFVRLSMGHNTSRCINSRSR